MAKGRASPHCITWIYRKKRHRKYFRSRIDALRFRNEKEQELGVRDRHEIENEIIFWALSEIKEDWTGLRKGLVIWSNFRTGRTSQGDAQATGSQGLRVAEAAKSFGFLQGSCTTFG